VVDGTTLVLSIDGDDPVGYTSRGARFEVQGDRAHVRASSRLPGTFTVVDRHDPDTALDDEVVAEHEVTSRQFEFDLDVADSADYDTYVVTADGHQTAPSTTVIDKIG
jgi:hypothetical protein